MSRRQMLEEKKMKNLIYIFSITLIFSIIAFILVFVSYNKKLKTQSRESLLELGRINDIVDNNEIVEETSFSEDKTTNTINEENLNKLGNIVENTAKSNTDENSKVKPNVEEKNKVKNTVPVSPVVETEEKIENQNTANELTSDEETSSNKELKFQAPVSGEIIKDFAKDTLIYSNTLEEWTTHSGIDIKADKTSVVAAAEEGVIESIKNDPRYGISVTISHSNGFKTVYSNLLTTEFISEGEKVDKGQTIATVGETASFEILDESHLHFEMYKDGECVNPTIYLK